ncbi:MAG: YlmC/YmxH family sporulation protein [Lachnospiraceae bacterium]|nr:YlmC/YmxH family sporulation protein [Lachnospiraceae bacterium]
MSNPLPPAAPPVRFCRFRQKEVINICTCRTLGCVSDLEIDPLTGCILSLIVPEMGRWGWFPGREFEYVIPWRCIVRTGTDIILVEVSEDDVRKKCIR